MTKAGTFTAEAVEALVARVEELEGDLALVKREKSILMRELSRFTNNA
jgi:hypothetical protein